MVSNPIDSYFSPSANTAENAYNRQVGKTYSSAGNQPLEEARNSPGANQLQDANTQKPGLEESREDQVQISQEAKNERSDAKQPGELTPEEEKELKELQKADRNVKAHEQAHRSAGGQYIQGSINYQYKKGPDGQMYAVAGEVSIDTSPVPDNPEATARKMAQIKRAALAPVDPSPTDRRVAAEAARKEAEARAESSNSKPSNPASVSSGYYSGQNNAETVPGDFLDLVA